MSRKGSGRAKIVPIEGGKNVLDALITTARGPRQPRTGAGIHADQHGTANRERTRGQNRRAAIRRELDH